MGGAERWMKGVKMRWMRERKEEMMIVMVMPEVSVSERGLSLANNGCKSCNALLGSYP